jgi:hypothetical protein
MACASTFGHRVGDPPPGPDIGEPHRTTGGPCGALRLRQLVAICGTDHANATLSNDLHHHRADEAARIARRAEGASLQPCIAPPGSAADDKQHTRLL